MSEPFTIQSDEIVEIDARQPLVIWLPRFILAVIWILLPFFFLFPLWRQGTIGEAVFALLLVSGLWYSLRSIRCFLGTRVLVTTSRLIAVRQMGFFARVLREIPLTNITSVASKTGGLCSSLFRYGKIAVEVRGSSGRLVCGPVLHPAQVQETLFRLLRV